MSTNPLVKAIVHRMSDPEWLSEQLGYPARATSLRIKPGTSVTASVVEAAVPESSHRTIAHRGWARVLWPGNEGKARKHQMKAAERGLDVRDTPLDGGVLFQRGSVSSDAKLMPVLPPLEQDQQVLRYNPERRLVIRSASPVTDTTSGANTTRQTSMDSVLRITAQPNPVSAELYAALAQHVSLPARLDDGSNPHLCELAFISGRDLSCVRAASSHSQELARGAGEIFAQLHACTHALPLELITDVCMRSVDPCSQAASHVELFDIMDPAIVDRLRGILQRMEPLSQEFYEQPAMLVHGDASPDQVLAGERMYLTDLDRMHCAPAAFDVGSYLAVVSDEEGEAFLEGYEEVVRGSESTVTMPSSHSVALATAMSMINRLAEPVRRADPEWHATTQTMLTDVDRLLTRVEMASAMTATSATTTKAGAASTTTTTTAMTPAAGRA